MKSVIQAANRRTTPGDLTEFISIEAETRTADGYAGATYTWAKVMDAWASVEPLFVGEREQQGAIRNVTQYRFVVYRTSDITEQMRIVFDGATHAIKGIRRGGANELFMDIITETGLGD
jgi:SPP1 family predicted phage head-tail adaptor